MGPPGAPFRLGPGENAPVPPLWAALDVADDIATAITVNKSLVKLGMNSNCI